MREQRPDGSVPCPPGEALKAEEVPLSPEMARAWQLMQQFHAEWDALPRRGSGHADTQGGNVAECSARTPQSVFDYLGDYSARTALHDQIPTDCPGIQHSLEAATAARAAGFAGLPQERWIAIRFADGSRVRVAFHARHQTLTPVPGSARLPNGEPVVEAASVDYAGNYSTAGVDVDAYVDFLRTRGVNVVGGGPPGRVVCTWDRTALTCKAPEASRRAGSHPAPSA